MRNPSTPGGDGDAAASSSAMPPAGSAETHLQETITHREEREKVEKEKVLEKFEKAQEKADKAEEKADKAEEKVDEARHTLDTVTSDDKGHSVPATNGGGESGKAPTEPSLGQLKKLIETVEGTVAILKKPERQVRIDRLQCLGDTQGRTRRGEYHWCWTVRMPKAASGD